jgi:hypothetical protein
MSIKQATSFTHKYWECECCGQLITTMKQDSAAKYQCPACKISGCEHGGKFAEITLQDFCKNANITCTELFKN